MKNKFTKIKTLCFIALFGLSANKFQAATITATVSGNWSSSATWSGGTSPGSSITGDNIVIPAGISVTMDMDVQVGTLASVAVSGSLTTTSNSLTINNLGSLSGNGTMMMQYIEIANGGTMSYSGSMTVHRFVNSSLALTLAAQVMMMDTLDLKAGSLTLGSGSNLTMNASSNIKVEAGSMALGTGGVFTNSNAYNVMYVGSTKTAGIEMSGSHVQDVWVNLSGSNQTLTLATGSLTINGNLHHNMGTIKLNGSTLTLNADYMSANGAMFQGSTTSNLMINSTNSLTSTLMFDNSSNANSSLNNLQVFLTAGGTVNLGSNMRINGELLLSRGNLNMANTSTLTMVAGSQVTIAYGHLMTSPGGFNGTASYNVKYIGTSTMGDVELSGSGLNDVTLVTPNQADSVSMPGNVTINGTLNLTKGNFNLNGHRLDLKGNLSTTINGYLQGNQFSDLYITTTGNVTDTMMFEVNRARLHSLNINIGGGSNLMLNSPLTVETMSFTSGGITIWNDDITITSTGSIAGANGNRYVMIKGMGSLVMNVNPSSPYVMYPVGTSTSYGAAYIQRNSGSAGMVGVSTHNGIYMMGTSGADNALTQSVVNRTWDVHSNSAVDLNLMLEWTAAMEVNSFNRSMSHISHYTNNAWDTYAASSASVSGSYYQQTRTGITSLSPFSVVDNNATVGIEEQKADNMSASVYPVPVENRLNFSVPNSETFNVEVYDAVGNKVKSKAFTQDTSVRQLDMSDLNSGVYFVKIYTDKSQTTKRIVKN